MEKVDVIIIGGGASGMIAARELSKGGKKVVVIEARNRLGGRIHTLIDKRFPMELEAGAEFLHGDLPITTSLLKEAGIEFYHSEGEFYRIQNGKISEAERFIEGFPHVISLLKKLKQDISFAEFLNEYLSEPKYASLRESVRGFAEGFDAADIEKVSSFALRKEWENQSTTHSFRFKGGHGALINFLANESKANGCLINLSTAAKKIIWKHGNVEVICGGDRSYIGKKVLITLPVGVLKAKARDEGYIIFSPEIPSRRAAIELLGYGDVIKILLIFKKVFWDDKSFESIIHNRMSNAGFILSDASFNAWWTQFPNKVPLLTGWFAGPKVKKLNNMSDDSLVSSSLDSLAYIFGTTKEFLQGELKSSYVANWTSDPFTRGAYTYPTVGSEKAVKTLAEPLEDTIFFAGEGLYEGEAIGTVEAALTSGIDAVHKILS
jgi:monoamine oxidase